MWPNIYTEFQRAGAFDSVLAVAYANAYANAYVTWDEEKLKQIYKPRFEPEPVRTEHPEYTLF